MPSPSPAITPYTLSPHLAPLEIRDGRVCYRPGEQPRRKVAICGAPGQKQMQWDDPQYECWAMNNWWNTARDSQGRLAASRWFEQHQIFPDDDGQHAGEAIQNAHDMQWIRECPVPLYTTEPFPENPHAVVYDIDYYARKYRDYFTCSFAMQIALAIDEGFEEMLVCGLELLLGTKREATVESACVAYWLGLAEGRGIKVVLAPGRIGGGPRAEAQDRQFLLWHPYRYGHEYHAEADFVKYYVSRWDKLQVAI